MFELQELSLRNFKRHNKLDLEFHKGVTGIIGENGAGKSAIIKAFEYLVTGETDKTKADLLTLGEATGYVWGKFLVHGKECTLERHIDCSKVLLNYDGQQLKKATEVKELWNKLFSIDANIFRTVIVAHQKQIPMLFSGDQSVREKVFQKIFMVPPTDSIRRTVWDGYINKCPPPLPEENTTELELKLAENNVQIAAAKAQKEELVKGVLPIAEITKLHTRLAFLGTCQADELRRPAALQNVTRLETEVIASVKLFATAVENLGTVSIVFLRTSFTNASVAKSSIERKNKAQAELTALTSRQISEEEFKQTTADYAEFNTAINEREKQSSEYRWALAEMDKQLAKYRGLSGSSKACPTCGSAIADIKAIIEGVNTEKKKLTALLIAVDNEIKHLAPEKNRLSEIIFNYEKLKTAVASKQQELAGYKDVTFDPEEYKMLTQAISKYENDEMERSVAERRVNAHKAELDRAKLLLGNLKAYDGSLTIEAEQEEVKKQLLANDELNHAVNRLAASISTMESWQVMYIKQLSSSESNKKWNQRRADYLGVLQSLYDVLHTSKFPRRLIQSYSTLVEDELTTQLGKFNLPYRARIGDGFKIEMIDKMDRILPEVSGGQETVVGICLRLALHSMFSQSFPMLVLDEGTTHLDKKNVACYFDFIRELRQETKINQIILIDHHEALSTCVDHVINV